MKALTEPLQELAEFTAAKDSIKKKNTPVFVSGCVDTQKCHLINGLGEGFRYKVIITYSEAKARELYDDMEVCFDTCKEMAQSVENAIVKNS